jgi:hypothetical protein
VKGYLDTSVLKNNKILSIKYLADYYSLYYNTRTKVIEYSDRSTFGYTNTSSGIPYLIGPKPSNYKTNKYNLKPNLAKINGYDIRKAFKTLKVYEIYRRLGYIGKLKVASTLENTKLIGERDVITDLEFDYKAYIKGKSTR